jgi:hypothetical protein
MATFVYLKPKCRHGKKPKSKAKAKAKDTKREKPDAGENKGAELILKQLRRPAYKLKLLSRSIPCHN